MENVNSNPPAQEVSVTIAVGPSRLSNRFPDTTMPLSEFVRRITSHIRTPETVCQYEKMSAVERSVAKDVGGFVAGSFRGGVRKLDNLLSRNMITLDLDEGIYSPDTLIAHVYEALGRPLTLGYSTHSHTVRQPRIRIVIPLARSVTPQQYQALTERVVALCGLRDYTDDCSSRPAQLFYWPSASRDAAVWYCHKPGPLFNPVPADEAAEQAREIPTELSF